MRQWQCHLTYPGPVVIAGTTAHSILCTDLFRCGHVASPLGLKWWEVVGIHVTYLAHFWFCWQTLSQLGEMPSFLVVCCFSESASTAVWETLHFRGSSPTNGIKPVFPSVPSLQTIPSQKNQTSFTAQMVPMCFAFPSSLCSSDPTSAILLESSLTCHQIYLSLVYTWCIPFDQCAKTYPLADGTLGDLTCEIKVYLPCNAGNLGSW